MKTIDFTKYKNKQELIEIMGKAFVELDALELGETIVIDLGEKIFKLKKVAETRSPQAEVPQ